MSLRAGRVGGLFSMNLVILGTLQRTLAGLLWHIILLIISSFSRLGLDFNGRDGLGGSCYCRFLDKKESQQLRRSSTLELLMMACVGLYFNSFLFFFIVLF